MTDPITVGIDTSKHHLDVAARRDRHRAARVEDQAPYPGGDLLGPLDPDGEPPRPLAPGHQTPASAATMRSSRRRTHMPPASMLRL